MPVGTSLQKYAPDLHRQLSKSFTNTSLWKNASCGLCLDLITFQRAWLWVKNCRQAFTDKWQEGMEAGAWGGVGVRGPAFLECLFLWIWADWYTRGINSDLWGVFLPLFGNGIHAGGWDVVRVVWLRVWNPCFLLKYLWDDWLLLMVLRNLSVFCGHFSVTVSLKYLCLRSLWFEFELV